MSAYSQVEKSLSRTTTTMASSQTPNFYVNDYDWDQPVLSAATVNRPGIEVWEEELEGTLPEIFQRIPDASPRLYYQAKEIELICPDQTLQDLRRGIIKTPHEPIAWLDDRSRTGKPRQAGGWLTQTSLHAALKEKV